MKTYRFTIVMSKGTFRGSLRIECPMEHGLIQDWDDMEAVWKHAFDELKVDVREHPVLLSEPPKASLGQRMQIAKLFFEKFDAPKLSFQSSGVLSLYARGLTTGVVLDVGESSTHCSAVYCIVRFPDNANC